MTVRINKTLAALSVGILALAGCGDLTSNRPIYAGVPFKAKAKAVDKKDSLAPFTVTVNDATRSLEGARLAAHHEGTRYCVQAYGSSQITWAVNPLDADAAVPLVGADALYEGVCTP
ncbi:hypothetical protein [Phaeobacter sp.]|uniref:hypothetical protein n=1 Tax=Phaeobacter sp. TaxID=1902409 RepID=UPI0025FF968F|nr:hypothetical protein [Phaeobacter sp.]